ncbi:MAG: hypothetical protein ACFFCO_07970, partial [Promethearchaeota archaeon]
IIAWIVISVICGFIFIGIALMFQMTFVIGKNSVTPLTPEEAQYLFFYAIQWGPILFAAGFLLAPILVCLGKARMGW